MAQLSHSRPATRRVPYPVDPVHVAVTLSQEPAWCWLDGVDGEHSYLGVASGVQTAVPGEERAFLESLAPTRERGAVEAGASESGFTGGWVTALSYEFGVSLLGAPVSGDAASPAFALRLDVVLELDARSTVAQLHGPDEEALDVWWERYGEAFADPATASVTPSGTSRAAAPDTAVELTWSHPDACYAAMVDECRERIADGDAYVICLTDTAEAHAPEADPYVPLELFIQLRGRTGALRGGVIVAGDRALVSLSPERFLTVRDRTISTHPIKGTRPRGATEAEDARQARELAADPKERAENLMIVDLMRNDLSHVCAPGTVRVEGFLRVEAHPHVHQLVSTVTGKLAASADLHDILAACFPGGSMTGAPKRSAVEILHGLEGRARGLYSGCFGWISDTGDAELAMTIRSIELRANGTHALIGAGGGITIDSDPGQELAEKHLKATPLVSALTARARYS